MLVAIFFATMANVTAEYGYTKTTVAMMILSLLFAPFFSTPKKEKA